MAALRRYLAEHAGPAFAVWNGGQGLTTIAEFFGDMIIVQQVLNALGAALNSADRLGQLRRDLDPDTTTGHFNLRSRAGADVSTLRSAVAAAWKALCRPGDIMGTWLR